MKLGLPPSNSCLVLSNEIKIQTPYHTNSDKQNLFIGVQSFETNYLAIVKDCV
jgi:hypothetical protein